jgi:emfourin
MTKIHFEQRGGVLGREIVSDIDLNEVPGEEAQEIMRLISESSFFDFPQNLIARSAPDEFEYTISLDAGNTHHTIQTSDSNAPESLRPLLEKLSTLAKANNPGVA